MSFGSVWYSAEFQNSKVKNNENINEHVKERLKNIYQNYLNSPNIKLNKIYDVPVCSCCDNNVTIEMEYTDLTTTNINRRIQINIELSKLSLIPYSVNFG